MGVDTAFKSKSLHVNTSWKRFSVDRNVTIERVGSFPETTRFFTIGSCFANELRHALEQRGLAVLPKLNPDLHPLFPEEFKASLSWGAWDERAHLQFYNTFSIRQEFEKAFGLWTQSDDDYVAVTHAGVTKYWDPYRRAIYAATPEDFAKIRAGLDDSLKAAIHDADVAVITLGMTEAFFRPDGRATCQYNRFFPDVAFRATSFAENLANIDRVCEMYFGAYPDRHIVLSTSPVGLAQTFTGQDVVVANMESKSILRAVAGEISRKWPNVIYWPSYEIVLWNDNSWLADLRHVHPARVASIMDAFVECHIEAHEGNASTDTWQARDDRIVAEVTQGTVDMVARIRADDERRQASLDDKQRRHAESLAAKARRVAEILAERAMANEAKERRRAESLRLKAERAAAVREQRAAEASHTSDRRPESAANGR